MIKIYLFVLFILFISTGFGHWIEKKCNYSTLGFKAPLGFVSILFILQLFYYPLQWLAVDSQWLMLITCLLLLFFFIISFQNVKAVLFNLKRKQTLYVLFCLFCFLVLFYHLSIGMEFTDSQVYINYISQNINTEHLGQFSFTNGHLFESPDIFYLFQGYYYFASFMCWIINAPFHFFNLTSYVENITIISWGCGMIYSLISTMFIINVIQHFKIKSNILKYSIFLFATLFYNFYYWRVAFAFYGNTFRTLLVGMLIFELYKKYQESEKVSLIPIVMIIGAGLATSSSFLFISFDIIYLLMAYLYFKHKKDTFKTLSILAFPILLYTLSFISQSSLPITVVIAFIASLYYIFMFTGKLNKLLAAIDSFLSKYGHYVFLILVPLFFAIHSLYIMISNPGYGINFFNYFADHSTYDMTIDPFGIHANPLEQILILFKWVAIILIIVKSRKHENNYLSFTFAFALIIFLNPLTITSISILYTYNVYYRAFDILLNPFTLILFILTLYPYFNKYKLGPILLSGGLITSVCLSHLYLISPVSTFTSYQFHLDDGKKVDPIVKINQEELQVLYLIRDSNLIPSDTQVAVIAQLEGFKTFFPNTYQVFTRAQYLNPATRINDEFFEIAKRQYSWLERPDVDYTKACKYLEEYNVDIAIINFYESFEFDQATDLCMETIIKTDNYHVKIPYK